MGDEYEDKWPHEMTLEELLAEIPTEAVLREASMRLHNCFGTDGFSAGEVLRHFIDLIERGIVKEAEDG